MRQISENCFVKYRNWESQLKLKLHVNSERACVTTTNVVVAMVSHDTRVTRWLHALYVGLSVCYTSSSVHRYTHVRHCMTVSQWHASHWTSSRVICLSLIDCYICSSTVSGGRLSSVVVADVLLCWLLCSLYVIAYCCVMSRSLHVLHLFTALIAVCLSVCSRVRLSIIVRWALSSSFQSATITSSARRAPLLASIAVRAVLCRVSCLHWCCCCCAIILETTAVSVAYVHDNEQRKPLETKFKWM